MRASLLPNHRQEVFGQTLPVQTLRTIVALLFVYGAKYVFHPGCNAAWWGC